MNTGGEGMEEEGEKGRRRSRVSHDIKGNPEVLAQNHMNNSDRCDTIVT